MSKWSCLFIHSLVFELTNGNIVWRNRNPLGFSENSNNIELIFNVKSVDCSGWVGAGGGFCLNLFFDL